MTAFLLKDESIYSALAFEELLAEILSSRVEVDELSSEYLVLYNVGPAVVMGRFQNPFLEANISFLQENEIFLSRRFSGGGTVFHDLGNLNFSLIRGERKIPKQDNNFLIQKSFARYGIDLIYRCDGRSDLWVHWEGKLFKVGGQAFKEKIRSSVHHGTLLIKSDLTTLSAALKSPLYEEEAKYVGENRAIKSKRSPVINLNVLYPHLSVELATNIFLEAFKRDKEFIVGTAEELIHHYFRAHSRRFCELVKKNSSLDWVLGGTPKFSLSVAGEEIHFVKGNFLSNDFKEHYSPAVRRNLERLGIFSAPFS